VRGEYPKRDRSRVSKWTDWRGNGFWGNVAAKVGFHQHFERLENRAGEGEFSELKQRGPKKKAKGLLKSSVMGQRQPMKSEKKMRKEGGNPSFWY